MGVAILSGCQSSTEDETRTVRLPASWKKTNGNPKLDAVFFQMTADTHDVNRAVAVLAEPCMAEAGFDYVIPEGGDRAPTRVDGRLTVADAEARGYQSPLRPAEVGSRSTEGSEPGYLEALWGGVDPPHFRLETGDGRILDISLPTDGCEGRARRSVISKDDFRLMTRSYWEVVGARGEVKNRMEDDAASAVAEKKWSNCMGDAGYPVTDMEDNQAQIAKQFIKSDQKGTAAEKKRAVADAKCRERHLYPVVDRLRAALDDKALSEIEGPLTAWIEKRDRVLAKAAKALAEGP